MSSNNNFVDENLHRFTYIKPLIAHIIHIKNMYHEQNITQ